MHQEAAHRPPWTRRDLGIAAALAAASLLARLPFLSRFLNTWDSVLFALSLERYSVPDARPHPPGYPVYVAMAKLLRPLLPDENATLVALSLLLTAGCVALVYRLIRLAGSRRAAVAGTVLFALSPTLLHNSVIATSYPGEALFMVLVGLVAWWARQDPHPRRAAWLGATFALALGFRQSFLFYLTPLVAWAVLASEGRWRRVLASGAAAAAVALAWAVPMVLASGGLGPYLRATSLQTRLVVFAQTVFTHGRAAWDDHWTRLHLFVRPEQDLVLPVLVGLLALGLVAARRRAAWREALAWPPELGRFLLLWVGPVVLFYLLVFDGWDRGPTGYVLVLLPALYALFAWLGDAALRLVAAAVPTLQWRRAVAIAAPLMLLAPAPALAAQWGPVHEREVRGHDDWTEAWLGLREAFPPNSTAIVASYSWAHVKWFFPDYIEWSYLAIPAGNGFGPWALTMQTQHREDDVSFYRAHDRGPDGSTHPIPPGIRHVVLFDFQLAGENGDPNQLADGVQAREARLPNGWRILYFETDAAHPTIESYFRLPGNQPAP